MILSKIFDVIVIGGSHAGLSAAMTLGRSLRSTLIIDSGSPCNKQTPYSHNFLTQDGAKPAEISQLGKSQVLAYETVSFEEDIAIEAKKTSTGFIVKTQSGQVFNAKKLILATGIRDIMPEINGLADCWGISVVHCPYCHGYEIRHKKTGMIANGESAWHLLPMIKNLTDDLTILTQGTPNFDTEQLAKLESIGIQVMEKPIEEVVHENGYLKHVIFDDGSQESFEAAYAVLPFEQHSHLPSLLGCALNDQGYIQVDPMQKTTIEDVFACGDNCSRMRSVANAVASGNTTGAVVNMELSNEQF